MALRSNECPGDPLNLLTGHFGTSVQQIVHREWEQQLCLAKMQRFVDGLRINVEKDPPRWGVDGSVLLIIVFST